LATLFAAWAALDPALDVDLYLTGPDDLAPGTLRPARARGEMRFLGDVGTERLARLYRSTLALVHPALSEGFGLPLLEASAVGARVIACADAVPGPLRPHVDTFPAKDVHALGVLMTQAVGRSPQSEESRRFARTFSWDRCARETAGVYREVLEETRGR
jgi:alpha-1,3-rhamnosyl/mannosyltransferase